MRNNMATSFSFLQVEKELQEKERPAPLSFLEAEKRLQQPPQPARTAPVRASQAQPTSPTPTPVTAPVEPPTPSDRMPTAFTTEVGGVDITGMGSALEMEAPVSVSDIASQKDKLNIIQRYMKERFPNKPMPKEPVKLVEEFQRSQAKNDFELGYELTWALNAKPEQKEVARQAYGVAKELGTTFTQELGAVLTSPSTLVGPGAGWAVKQALLKPAVVGATKRVLAISGTTAGVEAAAAGTKDIIEQKTEVALELKKEIDYGQTAMTVGLAAALGGVSEGIGIAAIKVEQTPTRIASLIQRRSAPAVTDEQTQTFLRQFAERERTVATNREPLFADSFERRATRQATLDRIDEPTDVTEAVLNEQTISDIFSVVKQIYVDNPLLRPDLNQVRITQAVADTLRNTDVDTIQQAAARAGVNNREFLDTFMVTLSQAGATLKEASTLSQYLRKAVQGDPDLERSVNYMSKASSGISTLLGTGARGLSAGAGVSVGASTLALSTAVLNAVGVAGSVGIKTAVDLVDSVYRTTGRMVYDVNTAGGLLGGGLRVLTRDRIKEDTSEAFRSSFYVLTRMVDAGYTRELSNLMLRNQPRLESLISNIGAEVDNRGMPAWLTKTMDTLNVANRSVDALVRRPFFVQSVKERLDALGLDVEDFIANNKPIPVAILKDAVDDAMKLTFSYQFRKTGEKSIEGYAESAAFTMLRAIEQNPLYGTLGKLTVPFLPFYLNAIRHMYRSTPIVSQLAANIDTKKAREKLQESIRLRDEGNIKEAEIRYAEAAGLTYEAKKKTIESYVGLGALAYFVDNRLENSDIEAHQRRDSDGNVKDASGLFPYVNYSYLAEAMLLARDLGQSLWYTMTMTEEERLEEAAKLRKQASSLALNDEGRQALLLKADKLGLNRVRKFDPQKFMEVMTGQGRASLTQNTTIQKIVDWFEDGFTTDFGKKAGSSVGDFIGRFDNVLNPIYDVINAARDDYRVVDSRAPVEGMGAFTGSMAASLMAPIPGARDLLEERPSLFQTTPQQLPRFLRQLQGERPSTPTSLAENELARLRIPSFSLYKTTGDRTLDNLTIKEAAPLVKATVDDLVNKDENYPKLSINGQREAMQTRITTAINIAKQKAQEKYMETNPEDNINRLYDRLSKQKKDAAVDLFIQTEKRRPKSLRDKLRIIHGEFDVAEAIGKDFNKGGFVLRR